jgi:hypothetical protein
MVHNIKKAIGEVMHRTSARSLTSEEIASPVEKQARLDFDIQTKEKFGPSMTKDYFKDDPNFADFETLEYEPCEDGEVPTAHMPDIDDIHDVDTYDQYVGDKIRVQIGDEIRTDLT